MEKIAKNQVKNRRRATRRTARSSTHVECRRSASGFGPNLALALLDISEEGARILLKEPLEVKQEVQLEFTGYGMSSKMRAVGRVAWVLKLENGNYAAGLIFEKRLTFHDLLQLARPASI